MASACMPASVMDMIDVSLVHVISVQSYAVSRTYLVVGEKGVWFCWSAVGRDDHAMPLSPAIQ